MRTLMKTLRDVVFAREFLTFAFMVLAPCLVFVLCWSLGLLEHRKSLADMLSVYLKSIFAGWMLSTVLCHGIGRGSRDFAKALYSVVASKHPPMLVTVLALSIPSYLAIGKLAEVSLGAEIGLPAWLMPSAFGVDPIRPWFVGLGLFYGACFVVSFLSAITTIYAIAGPSIEIGTEGNSVVVFWSKLAGYFCVNIVFLACVLFGANYVTKVSLSARGAPASDKTVSVCFKDKSRIDGEAILTTDKIVVFKTATSLEAYPHDQISHASCAEIMARQGEPTLANTSILFFRELPKQQQEPVTDH